MLYNRNVDGLDGGEVNLNTYNVHGKNREYFKTFFVVSFTNDISSILHLLILFQIASDLIDTEKNTILIALALWVFYYLHSLSEPI